jgi:hypothetical protein
MVVHPSDTQKSSPDEESKSQQTKDQCSIQFAEVIFDRHHRRRSNPESLAREIHQVSVRIPSRAYQEVH